MDTCEKCGGDIDPDDDHHTIIEAEAELLALTGLECSPGYHHEQCCPVCSTSPAAVAHG